MLVKGCLACRIGTNKISVLEMTASRGWRFRDGRLAGPGGADPSDVAKAPDVPACHYDTFGPQEGALQVDIAPVAPDEPASGNDSVTGHVRIVACGHGVADSAPGSRRARQRRDVSVRGNPAWRDSPDGGPDARGERRGGQGLQNRNRTPTLSCGPPRSKVTGWSGTGSSFTVARENRTSPPAPMCVVKR